jgi:hypothetical protein
MEKNMKLLTILLYILGLSLGCRAVEVLAHPEVSAFDLTSVMSGLSFYKTEMMYETRSDEVSARFSQLRRIRSQPGHGSTWASVHPRVNDDTHSKISNVSAVGDFSTQYAIQCGWDGEPVWLILDTGSSDTWATKSDFQCKDETGKAYSQAACGFGGPLIDEFGRGEADGVHLSIGYGSGEKVSGPMGYSDITCGGLSVSKQQVALVNSTYWRGNNVTVGVLGLAYPSLTNAFYGKLGDEAPWNAISYAPFFTTAMTQGTIDPVFSVAISKNSSDGMVAWGGLPPVAFNRHTNASTDLIIVSSPCCG